jgi:hypothetical protein
MKLTGEDSCAVLGTKQAMSAQLHLLCLGIADDFLHMNEVTRLARAIVSVFREHQFDKISGFDDGLIIQPAKPYLWVVRVLAGRSASRRRPSTLSLPGARLEGCNLYGLVVFAFDVG